MANREQTNAVIRELLTSIGAVIERDPGEETICGSFFAALPTGEGFYASAERGADGGHRIVLSPRWGTYETVSDGGRNRSERVLTEGGFLPRDAWGQIGRPTFSAERPLDAIARAAERRFFAHLRALWPRAVEYREQCAAAVRNHLETAEMCAQFKRETRGGYSLNPSHIAYGGRYATFSIDIPKERLALFYSWCEENRVAR